MKLSWRYNDQYYLNGMLIIVYTSISDDVKTERKIIMDLASFLKSNMNAEYTHTLENYKKTFNIEESLLNFTLGKEAKSLNGFKVRIDFGFPTDDLLEKSAGLVIRHSLSECMVDVYFPESNVIIEDIDIEYVTTLEEKYELDLSRQNFNSFPTPIRFVKAIFSGPAVILFYSYRNRIGKVVAKCHPEDEYDGLIGLEVAILKAFEKMSRELKDFV